MFFSMQHMHMRVLLSTHHLTRTDIILLLSCACCRERPFGDDKGFVKALVAGQELRPSLASIEAEVR
jgi:hypothetical protein